MGWSDPTSLPPEPWRSLQPSEQDDSLFTMCFARVQFSQEKIRVAVEKYATFIQSTPDHVVNSALKIVIWRDVEFRRWRKQTQADRKDGHAAPKAARA